jgi:hypothetical protein
MMCSFFLGSWGCGACVLLAEAVTDPAANAPAASCVHFSRKFRRVGISGLLQLAGVYTSLAVITNLVSVGVLTARNARDVQNFMRNSEVCCRFRASPAAQLRQRPERIDLHSGAVITILPLF